MSTKSFLAVACHPIEADGSLASPVSSYPCGCSRGCSGDGSSKHWLQPMTGVSCGSAVSASRSPIRQCSPSGSPRCVRAIGWLVYAKRLFVGPEVVLAYLSRYTHRVAISNQRLIAFDELGVTFHWKDYRIDGRTRHKTMTLAADEFRTSIPSVRAAWRLLPYSPLRSARESDAPRQSLKDTSAAACVAMRGRSRRRRIHLHGSPEFRLSTLWVVDDCRRHPSRQRTYPSTSYGALSRVKLIAPHGIDRPSALRHREPLGDVCTRRPKPVTWRQMTSQHLQRQRRCNVHSCIRWHPCRFVETWPPTSLVKSP
jgi:hypothetical protein